MNPNLFISGGELDRRLAAVLYRCLEDLGSTKGAYYIVDPSDGVHHLVSHYGWPRHTQPPQVLPANHPLLVWACHERRAFAVNDPARASELEDFCQGASQPRFLVSPAFHKGEPVGLLVQRDRLKGEVYDLARDEAPTQAICQELVALHMETHEPAEPPQPETVTEDLLDVEIPTAEELSSAIPLAQAALPESTPIPVRVPPTVSMVPTGDPLKDNGSPGLESFKPGAASTPGNGPPALPAARDLSPEAHAEGKALGTRRDTPAKTGMFPPEQRTFFWEAAALLCEVLPLAAVALWMDESSEIRPVLTYSEYPLSTELKHQVLTHVTYHVPEVELENLHLLSHVENLDSPALSGIFLSYLPVLLKGENSGQDLLLLLRMDDRPFTATEQVFIQHIAKMLGFHLQETRLHERYHRAFLSVSHRILASAEGRAPRLRNHSMNTAKLARSLAVQMELPSTEVESVSIAAILHDVGTLLLDPKLLSKDRLTPEEWARMRTHPVLASTFLKDFSFPFDVLNTIKHHHERWDGQGYPEGLKGEAIPIGSRIIALIEAFEVMASGTPFKAPMAPAEIREELRREAGSQFDPAIVSEFLRLLAARPVQ